MRILSAAPWRHTTGELLTPARVNQNFSYLERGVRAVCDYRYADSVAVLPFWRSCGNGYTQADTTNTRSYRIPAPRTVWIQRAYLEGALASGAATVNVYDVATGLAPSGITNPVFTPTTTDQSLFFGQEIQIPSGSTYRFTIEGTAFATSKLDLVLHLRTDRWVAVATDADTALDLPEFTEASTLNATTISTAYTDLTTKIAASTTNAYAPHAQFYVAHDFTSSTDVDLLRWSVPRGSTGEHIALATSMYSYAEYASNGAGGNTIVTTLTDQAGSSTGLATSASMSGTTFTVASPDTASVNLVTTAGAESLTASDYRVTMVNNAAINCVKSYSWIWVD